MIRRTCNNTNSLHEHITSKRKLQEISTIGQGWGRKFPELATVLMCALGELDARDGSAWSWSTSSIIYWYAVTAQLTVSWPWKNQERCCYDSPQIISRLLWVHWTTTQKTTGKETLQAKQHHCGQDVNTKLSLKKPPQTDVQQLMINLHWTTANVNLILDRSQDLPQCLLVSKDAKEIVPTDIVLVHHPSHSWKSRVTLSQNNKSS